jgi:hypothetical protein
MNSSLLALFGSNFKGGRNGIRTASIRNVFQQWGKGENKYHKNMSDRPAPWAALAMGMTLMLVAKVRLRKCFFVISST